MASAHLILNEIGQILRVTVSREENLYPTILIVILQSAIQWLTLEYQPEFSWKGQNLEFNQYGYLCLLKNFWAKTLFFYPNQSIFWSSTTFYFIILQLEVRFGGKIDFTVCLFI